ncbi:MAG: cupin domain-containing protein [Actinomycetota bacterium]|nr:cupin domain-containing protein [Actinomycetota bacterium]
MTTTTPVLCAPATRWPIDDDDTRLLTERPARPRARAVSMMAAGVALTVAGLGLTASRLGMHPARSVEAPATTGAAPTTAITIDGPQGVAVLRNGYAPQQSSSWHRHSGLHAVVILSGTLTVYGPDCRPVRYGPGQSWVVGRDVHLARNDTDEPVEMTETLLFPAGVPMQDFVVPATAPAGCDVR